MSHTTEVRDTMRNNKILTFRNGTVAVNDIFFSSWGYEQTNINFYQVVSLKGKKTVIVREIRSEVTNRESSYSGKVLPQLNDYIGEPLTRRIKECGSVPSIAIDDCEYANKTSATTDKRFSCWA